MPKLTRWSPSIWPLLWPDEDIASPASSDLTVYETDTDVIVKANVAGVSPDNVDISLEGGVLTVKAEEIETDEEKKAKKTIYQQARETRYYYTTSIPRPVKSDKIDATVKNGILTVTLPKQEEAKPKKIKVKSE